MNRFMLVAWLLVGGAATPLNGQHAPASPAEQGRRPMQDNSFLVEEAYNQEPGVVQHISTLQRSAGQWQFGFTQEWPLGGLRNQLSYDVPVSHDDGGTGIGDIALNYRRQLVGTADTRLAIAPRVTALLPTGNSKEGRGAGGIGLEVRLPISYVLAPRWVFHVNAGATLTPRAHGPGGGAVTAGSVEGGASLIWLAFPTLNLMLETVWARERSAVGAGLTRTEDSWFVSPGVRYAINAPGDLQIVPGIAYLVGLGPSGGEGSLFLYLSFEHAFRRH